MWLDCNSACEVILIFQSPILTRQEADQAPLLNFMARIQEFQVSVHFTQHAFWVLETPKEPETCEAPGGPCGGWRPLEAPGGPWRLQLEALLEPLRPLKAPGNPLTCLKLSNLYRPYFILWLTIYTMSYLWVSRFGYT